MITTKEKQEFQADGERRPFFSAEAFITTFYAQFLIGEALIYFKMILKWYQNRGNAERHQTGCFEDNVAFQHIDGEIITTKKVISVHERTLEGSFIV